MNISHTPIRSLFAAHQLAVAILVALLANGCVQSPEQKTYDDESKEGTITSYGGGIGGGGAKMVTVPISVDHKVFALAGTAATAWSVTLAGCLSGYGATVTQANGDIEVYKDDRTCLAKLTQFTAGGVTYSATNPGATNFTTWTANDTAYFTNAAGTATIYVKVISQLQSPIANTEAVVYNFSELLDGTGDQTFSEASVSDAHAITVESQEAPLFDVVAANFTGMDDTTGAPEFTFKLACVDDPEAVTPVAVAMVAGSGAKTQCGNNDLNAVTYKLVKDTYSSVLTIANANAIFGTAGTAVTIPTDQYDDGGNDQGFNTVTLDGPGGLGTAGNENMILILKAGLSYTYYNIDVTTITQ